MKIGDFGTVYNPGQLRLSAVIIAMRRFTNYPDYVEIEEYTEPVTSMGIVECNSYVLSKPGKTLVFDAIYFIPRGEPGGMMLLEQQIEDWKTYWKQKARGQQPQEEDKK